jgi:hypothetical protein
MSLVQTATSNHPTPAPRSDPSSSDSAKTKTIVDGATQSGGTVRAADIKSAAFRVGTTTKALRLTAVQLRSDLNQDDDAQLHQTVSFGEC